MSPTDLYRKRLRALLASIDQGNADLASIHAELSQQIIAELRALPSGKTVNAAQLQARFDAAFAKSLPKRVSIVRDRIKQGADAGRKASRQTFRAVFGEQTTRGQVRASAASLKQASERIAGRVTVDGKALAVRMRGVDREVSAEMARTVQAGIRGREGILGAARKIEKLDPREAKLPAYLQEIEQHARAGETKELKRLAKSYAKRIARMGEVQIDGTVKASKYSLRSATKKFVSDVQKASADGLDAVVKRYVEDRAVYRANVIARSESVEAMRRSYIEQARKKPGVIGFAWRLSGRHATHEHGGSKQDVCDIYAQQNKYGLGPGIYPPDKVPTMPHPCCIPPGHLIETSAGKLPIEQIEPGMLVRTHSGAFQRVLRLSKIPWRGQLVVATIGNKRLVATPEHPVLTAGGWKNADCLVPGDRVFVRVDSHDSPADRSEVPLLLQINAPLVAAAVPVTGVDLDRNEERVDGGVNVVLADGALAGDAVSGALQRGDNAGLVLGRREGALLGVGVAEAADERRLRTAHSGVGGRGHLRTSLGSAASAGEELLIGGGALGDTRALQHSVNGATSDSKPFRDAQDAEPLLDVQTNHLCALSVLLERERALGAQLGRRFGLSRSARDHVRSLLCKRTDTDPELAQASGDECVTDTKPATDLDRREQFLLVQPDHLNVVDALEAAVVCNASVHFEISEVSSVERQWYAGDVHNFAVDEDESYVVNGIVTHNCLCSTTVVLDRGHFDRAESERDQVPEEMRDRKSPDAHEWLRQNPAPAAVILGPTRHEMLLRGRRVLDEHGAPRLVHDLLNERQAAE